MSKVTLSLEKVICACLNWVNSGPIEAIDELGKLRSLEVNKLIQVNYQDMDQLRAVYSGNEVLQILAGTVKFEVGERRKDLEDVTG